MVAGSLVDTGRVRGNHYGELGGAAGFAERISKTVCLRRAAYLNRADYNLAGHLTRQACINTFHIEENLFWVCTCFDTLRQKNEPGSTPFRIVLFTL